MMISRIDAVDFVVGLDTSYNRQSIVEEYKEETMILHYMMSCVVAAVATGTIVGWFVAVDFDDTFLHLLHHRISEGTTLSIVPVMFPNPW